MFLLPLSVPGNTHGTLILLGNSNCLGFMAFAASISISIGFKVFGFLTATMLLHAVALLPETGVLLDLLLRREGVEGCFFAYLQA